MKKVILFTLSLVLACNFAFGDTIPLNPLPLDNEGFGVSSFLHNYGNLAIGNQYTTGDIVFGTEITDFEHIYQFSIPDSGLNVRADPFNFIFNRTLSLNITNFLSELYDDNDNKRGFGEFFSVTNLVAGSYYIKISGIVDGNVGGSYDMDFSTTAPVPLPGAAILLGSGLLGLVGLRRREII